MKNSLKLIYRNVSTFSQITYSLLIAVLFCGFSPKAIANHSTIDKLTGDPLVWYLEFYFTEMQTSNIFSLVKNAEIENIEDWSFEILSEPTIGELNFLDEGKFEFIAPEDYLGRVQVKFLVCNLQEEDLCYTFNVRLILNPYINFKDFDFVIPKGLSPNKDGKNDVFIIPALEENPELFSNTSLAIFDRTGNTVYETKDYKNNWEGISSQTSQAVPDGVYFYTLQASFPSVRKAGVLIIKQ